MQVMRILQATSVESNLATGRIAAPGRRAGNIVCVLSQMTAGPKTSRLVRSARGTDYMSPSKLPLSVRSGI